MEHDRIQFSAKFDEPGFISPPTEAPVIRVRDVLICSSETPPDVAPEELMEHRPIASSHVWREEGGSPPVRLGRGLRIDRLTADEVRLVMNACNPRGHYFTPIRPGGQRYSFVRDVDLSDYEEDNFAWDRDGVIYDALSLARLVRDNGYSMQYAARIVDYEDEQQRVIYKPGNEGKSAYRVRRDRDWLDAAEGEELRELLSTYWAAKDALPPRVTRAMWRAEWASWLAWADLIIPTLVGGLEALVKTEPHPSTRQFVTRVPALAREVGLPSVDAELGRRMYDARSAWVHGAHVRLFAGQGGAGGHGPQTPEQWAVFGEIALLQHVLRAALRRSVEDVQFRAVFADDDAIRSRWPMS